MGPIAKLFGTRQRTELLIGLALLGETFPTELARVIGVPLLTAQRVLASFEREGIAVSRLVGRSRVFTLNSRMYGATELLAFLRKYAERTNVAQKLASLRRRPRRAGKAL